MKNALHATLLGSILFFSSFATSQADPTEKDPNAPLSSINFTPNGLVVINDDGNVETVKGSVMIINKHKFIVVDSDGNTIVKDSINDAETKTIENNSHLSSPPLSERNELQFRLIDGSCIVEVCFPNRPCFPVVIDPVKHCSEL